MKAFKFLVILIFVGLFGCQKDNNTKVNLVKKYNESLARWKDLKAKNGNSYTYKTTFVSWVGSGSTTEIKVENGKATGRSFEMFRIDNGNKTIVDSYTETLEDLGSHEMGAKPLTIDELYSSCIGKYLIADEDSNQLYFETNATGIMSSCGFVPDNCADDCFQGVTIEVINWIKDLPTYNQPHLNVSHKTRIHVIDWSKQ